MVRLTPELIEGAAQCTNAIKDRELDLRGYKIPLLENLGATLDQFDTIDLSENEIRKLDGFPFLKRLKALILIQNKIVRISETLAEYIPNISDLILTNNNIQELKDLDPLAQFKQLETLVLVRNPATNKPNYRLYVVHKVPQVRFLDFRRVTGKEREQAAALFGSKKKDDQASATSTASSATKTFVPGAEVDKIAAAKAAEPPRQMAAVEPVRVPHPATKRGPPGATQEDFYALRDAIKRAKTMDEVERLNALLTSGQYAGFAKANTAPS